MTTPAEPRILLEKSPGLIEQLETADPRLRVLVFYAAAVCIARFRVVPVLTQVKRSRSQQVALHGAAAAPSPHESDPCRAADLRTRGLLTDDEAQAWENELDGTIEYAPPAPGPRFTCATFETQEKALLGGRDPKLPPIVPHLHVQVPPFPFENIKPMVLLWDRGRIIA